jgi:hypothetical protein
VSKAVFIPAAAAVRTIIEVSPAKVVLELSVAEAEQVRGLIGQCHYGVLEGPFNQLNALVKAGHIDFVMPKDSARIPPIRFN